MKNWNFTNWNIINVANNSSDKSFLIEDIYKNSILTSDIIFLSLIGIDNLGVNCYFVSGLQIILHSYKFIIDIITDIYDI